MSAAASGESTPERILRAAERLFAADGFDRVTLRQIARAADQRNVAAAQYHFGSKEGLLAAIVDDHRAGIDDRRAELLEKAEAEGTAADLATLMSILVEPLAAKLDTPSGRAYLQIQAQGLSHAEMRPATRSLVRRLARHLGALESGPADAYRGRFVLLLLFHALADRARRESTGSVRLADRAEFVAALTRSLAGAFAGLG